MRFETIEQVHLVLSHLALSAGEDTPFFSHEVYEATLSTGVLPSDGQLARKTNTITRFGAFFDSALDRIADAALLLGFSWFYMSNLVDMAVNPQRVLINLQRGLEPLTWAVIAMLAMLAVVGSLLVSYTRARAEGLGIDCKVGWFERPERIVLVIIMGFAGLGPVIPAGLLILVALSFTTAFQRMAHVYARTRQQDPDSE